MTHCAVPEIPLTERRAYTMGEAAALVRLSVSTLYAERARGRLKTIKLAGRRLITREALEAYIAAARLDTGHSATGPVAEPLMAKQQSPRASPTSPIQSQINRGTRETNEAGPLPRGTGLQFCSSGSKKNNHDDDTY
jgi:excisionase family DNA binding protein